MPSFSHSLQSCYLQTYDKYREKGRGGGRKEWMRETKFGSWHLMDGLQTAPLPLDSMITCHSLFPSVSSSLSSISLSVFVFSSFSGKQSLHFLVCLLNSETPQSCWFLQACIFFCSLNVFAKCVFFAAPRGNTWNINYISSVFPFPLSPLLCHFFSSHSLWLTDSWQEEPRVNR